MFDRTIDVEMGRVEQGSRQKKDFSASASDTSASDSDETSPFPDLIDPASQPGPMSVVASVPTTSGDDCIFDAAHCGKLIGALWERTERFAREFVNLRDPAADRRIQGLLLEELLFAFGRENAMVLLEGEGRYMALCGVLTTIIGEDILKRDTFRGFCKPIDGALEAIDLRSLPGQLSTPDIDRPMQNIQSRMKLTNVRMLQTLSLMHSGALTRPRECGSAESAATPCSLTLYISAYTTARPRSSA
jgi:hypothetical protein